MLGVTAGGHHYGLFGSTGSTWTVRSGSIFTNDAHDKAYFSVALLPDNRPETLALFRKFAYNHVTNSEVEYRIDAGSVRCDYRATVKAYEGQSSGTIFALYPHQWKHTSTKLTDLTYGSVRGTMKVAVGDAFATETPIQGVLPMLPAEGVQDKPRMLGYVRAELEQKPPRRLCRHLLGRQTPRPSGHARRNCRSMRRRPVEKDLRRRDQAAIGELVHGGRGQGSAGFLL